MHINNFNDNFVLDLSWERKIDYSTKGGYPIFSVTQRPAAIGENDWLPPWCFEDWFVALNNEDVEESNRRRLLYAAKQDIRLIVAVNPSKIISLAEQLSKDSDWLIAELEKSGDANTLVSWLRYVRKTQSRALRPRDLWPNMELICMLD